MPLRPSPLSCPVQSRKRCAILSAFLVVLSLPLAAFFAACGGGSSTPAPPTSPISPPGSGTPDARADALLAQMSQAQKLQMVAGGVASDPNLNYAFLRGGAGWIPGIQQLGIPALYFADGSVGVGNGVGRATALPSSIASAAGWDTQAAVQYGTVIGTELSDYGINVNLGGNTNLIGSDPRDGRTFETKGEDPILAGKIAAAHLEGVQSQHVIADIKHFAYNDQETGPLPPMSSSMSVAGARATCWPSKSA